MTKSDIVAIADRCSDAYSFDRYGASGWRGAAQVLAKRGLSPDEIEAVLRSKWTRWAGDWSGKRYGRVSGADLRRFMDRHNYWARVTELTAES